MASVCDAHCHFFSQGFFRALGRECAASADGASVIPERLGWEAPGSDHDLADRWVAELDRHDVARAITIASVPGDEGSVAAAARRHPGRIAGAFMVHPGAADAADRIDRACQDSGVRMVCLFPAMHHVALDDERTEAVVAAAERHDRAVFVHCGALTVGVRKKLGLPSPFNLRLGNPLGVAALAARHPGTSFVLPHFGAGLFREALMAADAASNVLLDTSSSNSWTKYHHGLTLRDVFARALDVVGPARLLFGTDSSFFPRGWQQQVYEDQRALVTDLGLGPDEQALVFGGNFERVFGRGQGSRVS